MQHIGRRGLSRYFKSFRVWIAFGLILLGGLGLLGWISGLRILGSISSQFIPIEPDTAVFFILFGIILFVDILRPAHRPLKLTSLCFLMLISLYGSPKF